MFDEVQKCFEISLTIEKQLHVSYKLINTCELATSEFLIFVSNPLSNLYTSRLVTHVLLISKKALYICQLSLNIKCRKSRSFCFVVFSHNQANFRNIKDSIR